MNQNTEAQRAKMLEELAKILNSSKVIDGVMSEVPHPNGVAYRSLRPMSGMHIVHTKGGFTAVYQDKDGRKYEINFYQR